MKKEKKSFESVPIHLNKSFLFFFFVAGYHVIQRVSQ